MFDYNKIDDVQLSLLKQIASKASEKSPLDQDYYLYTQDGVEKAKIYLFCCRFLISLVNLTDKGDLQDEVKRYYEENLEKYQQLNMLINEYDEDLEFGRDLIKQDIRKCVFTDKLVDDMIDLFSVLTEKASVIQLTKLKGVITEGKSGENFNRVMGLPNGL